MRKCVMCDKLVNNADYDSHLVQCNRKFEQKLDRQMNNPQSYIQQRDLNFGNDLESNNNQNHEESKEDTIPCPICKKDFRQNEFSSHIEKCIEEKTNTMNTNTKKCPHCNQMVEEERYCGHLDRCKTRKEKKQFFKNYIEEKKKDEITESMLMDPNLAFLQCIYCQKDILESRYEEHLVKCEQEERCDLCKQSYPKEIFKDHQKMCRLQFALQMGEMQPSILCQRCNGYIPASQFEQHQLVHISEDEGFNLNQLQGPSAPLPQLDGETQKKIENIYNDPRNQQINQMSDDQLYKHFHEVDLNEFQKNHGVEKKELEENLSMTFYRPNIDGDNDEDKTCLICQDEFKYRDKIRKLPCKHQFHGACVDEWFQRNAVCPVCRKDIKEDIQQKKEQNFIKQQSQPKIKNQNYNNSNFNSHATNISPKPYTKDSNSKNDQNHMNSNNNRIYNNGNNILNNFSGLNDHISQNNNDYQYNNIKNSSINKMNEGNSYQYNQQNYINTINAHPHSKNTTNTNTNNQFQKYGNLPPKKASVKRTTVQNTGNNIINYNHFTTTNQQEDTQGNGMRLNKAYSMNSGNKVGNRASSKNKNAAQQRGSYKNINTYKKY